MPDRIVILIKDLIAFKNKTSHMVISSAAKESRVESSFMMVHYHNKGIDMLNLPKILNSTTVINAVPQFLNVKTPPIVSYSYTKTISQKNIES